MSIFDILILVAVFYVIHNYFGYGYIDKRLNQAHKEFKQKTGCPYCNSKDITYGTHDSMGEIYEFRCNSCGHSFN